VKTLLLKNARVILPGEKLEKASVLIEDGRIARVTSEDIKGDEELDLAGQTVYPGFIDIHIHGANGVDVMSADLDGLRAMAAFLAKNGVARWLPTLVPDSPDNYQRAVKNIDEFIAGQTGQPVAQITGLHYEGPFVNEKQCGALRPQFFRAYTGESELSSLPTLTSPNARHLMTLAPEVAGGIDLIKELKRKDWIVSIGHSRAGVEILNSAFAAGARHMTHFFNAMSGLHHRDIGAVGWGLTHDEVSCDVIADGVHVHPEILKLLHRVKTSERISLISDSVLPAGLGDGEYKVWEEIIRVENGRTRNERGSIAGSVITMLDAVKMMLSLGISQGEVSRMAGANSAKLLGLENTHGSIEPGKCADLTALDEEGKVTLTVIEGQVVLLN
jgi:N-acetylglucosamine-6-phosphate deacetylase